MDATIYKPEVAFRTKAKNVVQVTPETPENPATYSLTVKPVDVTELGASPIQVAIGDYVMDFIGTPYKITNVALPKITVSDDFRSGACPTSGQTAIVYRSVGDGNSPYLSPIYYRFLDKQALANSKRFELDILWKKLYSEVYVLDPLKWLKNSFSSLIEFGQALGLDHSINGEQSTALGIGNQTQSFRETILGSYAKDTSAISPTVWEILDLLLTVGNGTDDANRSNAVEVFKSGLVKLFNGLLIGEYAHGAEAPPDGMLQINPTSKELEIAKDGVFGALGGGGSFPATITSETTNADDGETHTHELGDIDISSVVVAGGYGALYNWYAATDARKITSSDDWVVPTQLQWEALFDSIDVYDSGSNSWLLTGGYLKETGFIHWNAPNAGATNGYGFNAIGVGSRDSGGTFDGEKLWLCFLSTTENGTAVKTVAIGYDSSGIEKDTETQKGDGSSLRLCNPSTLLSEGSTGTYTQNNGEVIPTIVIGGVEWTMNLNETKYRNGDWISGYDGGVYTPISNEDWAALTTEAMCYYSDNEANGGGQTPLSAVIDVLKEKSHNPVTIAVESAALASIDANQVLTILGQGGNYALPTATASVLGGVKIGTGISIDANGVISVSTNYDNYGGWSLLANSTGATSVLSGGAVDFIQGTNVSISKTGNAITISVPTIGVDATYVSDNYEPKFSKNTAFNKSFGTTAGTVLEGRTFGTAANSATTDFAAAIHTHAYDNYGGWSLLANSTNATSVLSSGTVNFIQGDNVSISKSGNNITINVPTIGSMVYPTAGIAVSTGSAWGTSIANNSANWNSAYDNMYKVGLGYYSGGHKMSPVDFWYDVSDFIVLQKTDEISSGNNYPATSHGVYGALQEKQATLVSGTNIKTINGASILGSGNLTVTGAFVAHAMNNHTDVAFTYSPSNGDLMQYNGSAWTQRSIKAAGIAALAGSLTQQFSTQRLNLPGGGYIEVQSNNIHIYPGSTQVVVHGQVTADSFYKN